MVFSLKLSIYIFTEVSLIKKGIKCRYLWIIELLVSDLYESQANDIIGIGIEYLPYIPNILLSQTNIIQNT